MDITLGFPFLPRQDVYPQVRITSSRVALQPFPPPWAWNFFPDAEVWVSKPASDGSFKALIPGGKRYEPQIHPAGCQFEILDGTGTITIGSRTCPYQAGDTFVVPQGQCYAFSEVNTHTTVIRRRL